MSRGYLESIAERAAHFEDVDFKRYNRLKMKLSTINNSQIVENNDLNVINLQHIKNNKPPQQQQQQLPIIQNKKQQQDDMYNWKYEPLVARYYYTGILIIN